VYYLFEQALRAEDQERYYSFDYGNVHFVSLDSNGEMLTPIALDLSNSRDDDMIDWLTADLAKSKADWKVAFFHHPPFSLYPDRGDNVLVINQIMPALEAGGVDLVLLGHDHHYVRSLPVRGECEIPGGKRAIPYIVVGSGGAGLTPAVSPDDWYVAVKNDQTHAFLSVTFQDCKASARAIGLDGQDIDTFELDGCD
jgi:3',5'-cyclic AMP phosphodiesterase CpdA